MICCIFASGTGTPLTSSVWTMPSCLLPLERACNTNGVSCSTKLVSVPPCTKTAWKTAKGGTMIDRQPRFSVHIRFTYRLLAQLVVHIQAERVQLEHNAVFLRRIRWPSLLVATGAQPKPILTRQLLGVLGMRFAVYVKRILVLEAWRRIDAYNAARLIDIKRVLAHQLEHPIATQHFLQESSGVWECETFSSRLIGLHVCNLI